MVENVYKFRRITQKIGSFPVLHLSLNFPPPTRIMISVFKRAMSTNSLVTPQWLLQNLNKVRVIDATWMPADAYATEHIPGAAHYSFDYAYFKSEYIKFDLYPPEVFQKYIRLLGVNNNDQVVIYSRGAASGMMFASRAYWTFKVYGFTNVTLLNGGLDAWKAAGGSTNQETVKPQLGNVDIRSLNSEILANFEDIPFNHLAEKHADYIDARIPSQFTGQDPLSATYPGTKAKGSHVTGAINFPMADVIGPNGFLSQEEVDAKIAKLGLTAGNQVYVACNTGIQASVIFTALERSGIKAKLYNGSMTELAYRAPELVNATGK
ncbi:hypothetical protein B9Z55_020472 [Caenorhabditis nigoni]|uniref:Rhodanese domain-containing protein n=1 Tax=Caenorhabditis nigoni TaxID=1611254 RepID=A0A2G5TMU9_9PELO|nr:hypothetical protein B9Z55_020472 [Caenorhabditis nigoni]